MKEHVETLETQLLALDKSGVEADEEGINRAFRALHAIKGQAHFFDLANIGELTAQMEHALAPIRSHGMLPTQHWVSTLREDDFTETSRATAGARERPRGLLRMLLVEDNFTSRLLLQTFLSRYRECHIAVNGREAVEAFRSAQGAKIVMTTAVAQVKQVVECFRDLCDSYLLKPIDPSKLLSLMKSYGLIP